MSDMAAVVPKLKVLLADDDRLILATLSQGLQSAGFDTVEADSGGAALRLCVQTPPSIAVLDYDMPDVSGLEIAKALQPAAFPLIFLSAYGDDQIVRSAVSLGAMAYLIKPIDPLHLVPTMLTAMQRYSELAALRGESVQLNSALRASRATSVVVGLLMARLHLTEKEAYDRLRQYCRSSNSKVTDVAASILGAADRLNAGLLAIGNLGSTKGRGAP